MDKDIKKDLATIRKGMDFIIQKCSLENMSIYNSINIQKEMLWGSKIYIDVDDAFTTKDTGIPYKYMFGINILGDPIGIYFISEEIYQNLENAHKRLKKNQDLYYEANSYWDKEKKRITVKF